MPRLNHMLGAFDLINTRLLKIISFKYRIRSPTKHHKELKHRKGRQKTPN